MIRQIIFDLDGVLIDSSHVHRHAFIEAVRLVTGIVISDHDHLEALSTDQKLRRLCEQYLLYTPDVTKIKEVKKTLTSEMLPGITVSNDHVEMIRRLVSEGFVVQISSNCIVETVKYFVNRFSLPVFGYQGSDSVLLPKPDPSVFIKAFQRSMIGPHETLIVEDSVVGLEAARKSGAKVMRVKNPSETTYENVIRHVRDYPKFPAGCNILIPMAGNGERFRKAGYDTIKPLIPVMDKFMVGAAVDSLNVTGNYVFVSQKDHCDKYPVRQITRLIARDSSLVTVDGKTEGAAVTTLAAKNYIDLNDELLIVNSDQVIEWNPEEFFKKARSGYDGMILVFADTNPKWSFVRVENDLVVQVAEKNPISGLATVGVYWWRRGSDYVRFAEQMILKNIRTNGEFYVAPVYNEAITEGMKVGVFAVDRMHSLGMPEDLEAYLA